MAIPSYPSLLIPRPFASGGTFKNIPDIKEASGRASFNDGFPTETQLPMTNGGIAPNRMDFNGILNLLTTLGFWQQSGGMWIYQTALNYKKPNMVFHNNVLWWCVADNGPDTGAGLVEPGTDEAYWVDLVTLIKEMGKETGTSIGGVPVGGIVMFPKAPVPEGFLECNGSAFSATQYPQLFAYLGTGILPDYDGLFLRGRDPEGKHDPEGARRVVGSLQGDAIRNITGSFGGKPRGGTPDPRGAFYAINWGGSSHDGKETRPDTFAFDASRVVPTAPENRPKNKTVVIGIKHD